MDGLIAYGHSWVQGDGASRPARRFVDVVSRRLGCTATNLGVGGTLSTDTAELLSRQPPPASRLYLVMTGLNDARLHGTSSAALECFSAALQEIFDALDRAHPAALTIAVEQPHLTDYSQHAPHDRGDDEILNAYNQRQRALASRHPRVLLASVTGWDPETMLADEVHPNDAGHAQVARAVLQAAETSGPPGAGGLSPSRRRP